MKALGLRTGATLLALGLVLALNGCDDDNGGTDAGGGGGSDAGPGTTDGGPGGMDAGPGGDDAGPGGDDAGPGEDDAGPGSDDAGPPTDAGDLDPTSAQIQAVLDATPGSVTLMVEDAMVTYVKPAIDSGVDGAGFFVQAAQMGPALYVNVDPTTLTPAPTVGAQVDFRVTEVSVDDASAGGTTIVYASAIDMFNEDSSGGDVSSLVQEVSMVDLVTNLDDYIGELVELTATIDGAFTFAGSGFSAAQITTDGVATATSDLRLRVPDSVRAGSALGAGCTVDVGPTPMWRFDTTAQPSAWTAADFTVTSCPSPTADGDLEITEIGYIFAGSDDDLEFVEIYNPSDEAALDIGGCILADDNGIADADALMIPGSVIVPPGGYVVIAGDPTVSEIMGDVVLPTDLGFGGTDAVELSCGGTQIDIVDWNTTPFPGPEADDVSVQLAAGVEGTNTNDDVTNWCPTPASETYGTMGRRGTPGMPNVPCPCEPADHLVINEIDYDMVGDDDAEYIEIYNPTAAAVDLTGLVVILFNGSSSPAPEYDRITLSGSLPSGEYLVLTPPDGGSGFTVPLPATGATRVEFSGASNNVQNGPDVVALYDTGSSMFVDVAVYEGTIAMGELMDSTAVTFSTPDSIGEDSNTAVRSLSRVSDGCDRDETRDWLESVTPTPGDVNAP